MEKTQILSAHPPKKHPDPRYIPKNERAVWDDVIKDALKNRNTWLGHMWRRAKDRARRRKRDFNLPYEDFVDKVKYTRGRCEITLLPFSWDKPNNCTIAPMAPCIDRIDANQGYTYQNTRIVCNCVNTAMGQWGEWVLQEIVNSMVEIAEV